MKLTGNQKMLLGAAALVGVAVILYRRNKAKSVEITSTETETAEKSNFTTARGGSRGGTKAAYTKCTCIDNNGVKTGACMSQDGSCSCCSGTDYIKHFAV